MQPTTKLRGNTKGDSLNVLSGLITHGKIYDATLFTYSNESGVMYIVVDDLGKCNHYHESWFDIIT